MAGTGTALADAPPGAQLYAQHCASCHGTHGTGGVGVPLALADFQAGASDQYLRLTIRHGRPGRVMPAFVDLSDAEIDAIVQHLRRWAPTAGLAENRALRIRGDAHRGGQLYARHCATCHGAGGEGGQGTGVTFSRPRDLPIIAPALNNPGFQRAASDQMIKATLMQGRRGTPMDSFLEQGLSERDIDDVVSFVRTLAPEPAEHEARQDEPIALLFDSPHDLPTTVEELKRAAVGMNFRLIREQPLEQGLVAEGQEDPRQVVIYFCNFQTLNQALAVDPRVGLFLPCRVTVVEHDGKVQVQVINVKRLARLFNNNELTRMCDDMHRFYLAIIEEATL